MNDIDNYLASKNISIEKINTYDTLIKIPKKLMDDLELPLMLIGVKI